MQPEHLLDAICRVGEIWSPRRREDPEQITVGDNFAPDARKRFDGLRHRDLAARCPLSKISSHLDDRAIPRGLHRGHTRIDTAPEFQQQACGTSRCVRR